MENNKKPTIGRRPTHAAWWVQKREGKKDEWKPIGLGWWHSDNKGVSVALDCTPLDGRIVLRLIEPKGGR